MGVPEEDRRHVYEIGNKMVGFDDPEYHDGKTLEMKMKENDENMQLSAQMFMYAAKLREKALSHPGDDLATALVNVELDGRKLTPEEFNFFFLLLLIAGNETTRTVTTQRHDQPARPPRSAARAEAGHVAARRRGRGDPALLARRCTRSGAPPRSPPRSAARRSTRTRS